MTVFIYDHNVLVCVGTIFVSFAFFSDDIEYRIIQLKFVHIGITGMNFTVTKKFEERIYFAPFTFIS